MADFAKPVRDRGLEGSLMDLAGSKNAAQVCLGTLIGRDALIFLAITVENTYGAGSL